MVFTSVGLGHEEELSLWTFLVYCVVVEEEKGDDLLGINGVKFFLYF